MKIINKHGIPFVIHNFKKRKFFAIGFVTSLVLICYLTTYIWEIDITGNHIYTDEAIIKLLKENSIYQGIKSSKVDCKIISQLLREEYEKVIWVSASINGTCLKIHIKENIESNSESGKNSLSTPVHMIAEDDYIIKSITIRKGIPAVKEGDSVKKGDILVSGFIPIENDSKEIVSYQYCVADADINIETTLNYEDEIIYKYNNKNRDKNVFRKEYFLMLNDYTLKLGNISNDYEHFYLYSEQYQFENFNAGVRIAIPYSVEVNKYTLKEIQVLLTKRLQYYCKELEKKGVVILENDVKIYTWSEKAKALGHIRIQKSAGIHQQANKIEVPENINQSGEQINGNDGSNH